VPILDQGAGVGWVGSVATRPLYYLGKRLGTKGWMGPVNLAPLGFEPPTVCISTTLTRLHCPVLTYLITYLLTPWSRVLFETLAGFQLVKKFPAFYVTWRFITAFTSARHLSLSWASSIQSIPPHRTSWRSILILSSHLRLGLPSGLFPCIIIIIRGWSYIHHPPHNISRRNTWSFDIDAQYIFVTWCSSAVAILPYCICICYFLSYVQW